jgi:hypothetical protein
MENMDINGGRFLWLMQCMELLHSALQIVLQSLILVLHILASQVQIMDIYNEICRLKFQVLICILDILGNAVTLKENWATFIFNFLVQHYLSLLQPCILVNSHLLNAISNFNKPMKFTLWGKLSWETITSSLITRIWK